MFRKFLIVFAATAALGAGMVAMASTADAHHHHHGHVFIGLGIFPGFGYPGFGYPDYGYPDYGYRRYGYPDYYDDYSDCGYERRAIRTWNRSHTHHIIVYRKRWVCY